MPAMTEAQGATHVEALKQTQCLAKLVNSETSEAFGLLPLSHTRAHTLLFSRKT